MKCNIKKEEEDFIAFLIAVVINAGIFFGAIYVGSNGGNPVHFVAETMIIIISTFMIIIIALNLFGEIKKLKQAGNLNGLNS